VYQVTPTGTSHKLFTSRFIQLSGTSLGALPSGDQGFSPVISLTTNVIVLRVRQSVKLVGWVMVVFVL